MNPLSDMCHLFMYVTISCKGQMLLIFIQFNLSIFFSFLVCALCILFNKLLPNSRAKGFSPMSRLLEVFIHLTLTFKYKPFHVNFVYDAGKGQGCFLI